MMENHAMSPREVKKAQQKIIPSDVFEVVNHLLTERASQRRIVITQEEVVNALIEKGYERTTLFQKSYLDFEQTYREKGWKVAYDKPAYYETYAPHWVFTENNNGI